MIIISVLVSGAAFGQSRFAGLEKELRVIAGKNYGSRTVKGYRIGIAFEDIRTGRRISVNGSVVFPAASIIKLPVMAAIYSLADRGLLNLEKKVRFTNRDKLPGAGVLQWLQPNTYRLWNLCRLMISLSDNSATRLCVNTAGKKAINSYCSAIGLTSTRLLDETALAEAPRARINTTTALDTVKLLSRIQKGRGFSKASRKQMLSFMLDQKYRFGIPQMLPRGVKCANKTGNLERVLHDSAIVYTPRGSYALAVFTKGFKKDRDARLVINEVSAAVYRRYR